MLKLLFEYNADPNAADNVDGKSLLHLAVEGKHGACLEELLRSKTVDINCVDRKKETPLFVAVDADWMEGVRLLMTSHHGARPELGQKYGMNKKYVLQQAIRKENTPIVELLVNEARSFDNFDQIINVVNGVQMTPLFIAVLKGNLELLLILLRAQADVTRRDKWSRNVLHCAVEKGHSHIIEKLFREKPTEMRKLAEEVCNGKLQGTPLQIAINRDDCESAKVLIEIGNISISGVTDLGVYKNCNILHLASAAAKPEVINYFVGLLYRSERIRSLVSKPTDSGETPLHFALKRRQIDLIYALIAAGSDLTAKCGDARSSKTAIDILICQVPSSVDILTNVLNRSIKNDANNTYSVVVDYKVLMSQAAIDNDATDNSQEAASSRRVTQIGDSFGVLKALIKTGDRLGQKKLLDHPLVQSFVHLHWKRLEGPYLILVLFNTIFAFVLSLFVLVRLTLESPAASLPLVAFLLVFMALLFVHEVECVPKFHPWPYRVETLMRWACFVLTIVIFLKSAPECSAFAVLLAWFEVILLVSRIPKRGYYMLVFVEIAFKYIKLLLSFVFVLFGFVVAFMTIFGAKSPFDSFLPALMKTMVMMTNEFDYDNLYLKFSEELSTFSPLLAMGVFILFIIFMGLVLTNLFVAVAVDDVFKRLHLISKQTEFLGVYETFLLSEPWWCAPHGVILLLFLGLCALIRRCKPTAKCLERWESFAEVKSSYDIDILDNKEVVGFPEKLKSAFILKGYENREKKTEKRMEVAEKCRKEAAKKLKLKKNQMLKDDLMELMSAFERKITEKMVMLSEQVNAEVMEIKKITEIELVKCTGQEGKLV